MGLSYLRGKQWWEVSREERFFCSHLFYRIRTAGVSDFLSYLNRNTKLSLDVDTYWEIAYEACFYRDFRKLKKDSGEDPGPLYSPKRTFDLCLLSESAIVVIEAKAHQGFDAAQMKTFEADKEALKSATGVDNVYLIGLASSNAKACESVAECFHQGSLTWKGLAEHFDGDRVLARADDIHDPKTILTYGKNNRDGHLTGATLVAEFNRGEEFFVGRDGGLSGNALANDIHTGKWRAQKYETNRISEHPPSRNWFLLSEFVEALRR